MKGIVFTEFLEMVEEQFGQIVVESIIEKADLESEGAYTTVGSYPTGEMVALVQELSMESKIEIPDLLEAFGRHLFHGLHRAYPHFFQWDDSLDFLSSIHDYIHVEVKKLYADAELPNLLVLHKSKDRIELLYESPRRMADLARGLLRETILYFQEENMVLKEEKLVEDGSQVKFTLRRN